MYHNYMNNGTYAIKQKSIRDEVYAIILSLLAFLPLTTLYNMVRIGVAGLFFLTRPRSVQDDPNITSVAKRMVISPILPVLFVIMLEGSFSSSIVIHELMRMVYCALLIITVSSLEVSFRCIYIITLIVFIPNFAIQTAQYMHIASVTSFIRRNYLTTDAEWTHLNLADAIGGDFRAGSIFINPNVYMVIPLLALVVFLQKDLRKKSVINYILIGCTAVSCYFTGARTATVVFIVIIGLYIIRYAHGSNKAVLIIFAIISIALIGKDTILESRSFELSENDMSSLTVKLNGFLWFWNSTKNRILYWVTGSIGSLNVPSIDCEWGHIYSWFGVFGLSWYIKYLKIAYHNNQETLFYSKPITYVIGLVAITASVLLCMPIFSFVCVILLSHIPENSIE